MTEGDAGLPCEEFSEFKDALQQRRAIDDKIIYKLNTSVPTQSFAEQVNAKEQCMALYAELESVHASRTSAIQHCVQQSKDRVQELTALRDNDTTAKRLLRKEQTKLRLMSNELVVEEVVKERSMKVFRERCWKSFRPPQKPPS